MNIYNQINALPWCPRDEAKSIYNTFTTAPDYSMPCKVEKLLLCLVYEGCFDDAITLAEGIIAHYAGSYTAYLFLGIAYDLKGERARAIEAYKQLLIKGLMPDKPAYYDQFGIYGLDEDFVHFLIETPFSMDNVNSFTFRLPFEKLFRRERAVRHTQHFSIYYEENSTAAKDIDAICETRETAYGQVAKYFGFTQDITVDLYLYEDSDTKTAETGHTGAGWAFSKVMVEIYNDKQKMNPVHELIHVIAGLLYGKSVSAFSEGLAVFLVNALGYTQVGDAVNGDYKHQVRTLLAKNELFPLRDLLAHHIGTRESKPRISYPQAAAWVALLLDELGRDKFFALYATLVWDNSTEGIATNVSKIEMAYGNSINEMEKDWLEFVKKFSMSLT